MPIELVCVGATNMDRKAKTKGSVQRGTSIPVTVSSSPGGVARNVAENLARLGQHVRLVSRVGQDKDGDYLCQQAKSLDICVDEVSRSRRYATASYTAVLEPTGELALGLADMDIYEELSAEHFESLDGQLWDSPIVFLDTNLPATSIEYIVSNIPATSLVVADPVSVAKSRRLNQVLNRLFAFFPNREEAQAITGIDTQNADGVEKALERLHELGVKVPIITLGASGACIRMTSGPIFLNAPEARVRDVTGAGDSLIAGFLHGYQLYGDVEHAIELGLTAAAITTESDATVSVELNAMSVMERHRALWGG